VFRKNSGQTEKDAGRRRKIQVRGRLFGCEANLGALAGAELYKGSCELLDQIIWVFYYTACPNVTFNSTAVHTYADYANAHPFNFLIASFSFSSASSYPAGKV